MVRAEVEHAGLEGHHITAWALCLARGLRLLAVSARLPADVARRLRCRACVVSARRRHNATLMLKIHQGGFIKERILRVDA